MVNMKISCESCRSSWIMEAGFSLYLQEAIEHRPCPCCGAYTLVCHEPDGLQPPARPRSWAKRRRQLAEPIAPPGIYAPQGN